MLPMLADNYAWVLYDGTSAAVVDPGDAVPVLRFLKRGNLALTHILVTHHHADHCAGVEDLRRAYPCRVIGPDDVRVPHVDDRVRTATSCTILSETMEIITTPGHTMSHVVYHFPKLRALFTGDTLFCAGCGRLLEGSPSDMLQSLIKCIRFEGITFVYCGHEYTEENLMFATMMEPDNKEAWQRLADVKYLQRRGVATVPSTIAVERATNPFLRTGSKSIRKTLGMESATEIEVLAELRKRKDKF
jgi:hydroxyacylglutathione hydrolase